MTLARIANEYGVHCSFTRHYPGITQALPGITRQIRAVPVAAIGIRQGSCAISDGQQGTKLGGARCRLYHGGLNRPESSMHTFRARRGGNGKRNASEAGEQKAGKKKQTPGSCLIRPIGRYLPSRYYACAGMPHAATSLTGARRRSLSPNKKSAKYSVHSILLVRYDGLAKKTALFRNCSQTNQTSSILCLLCYRGYQQGKKHIGKWFFVTRSVQQKQYQTKRQ